LHDVLGHLILHCSRSLVHDPNVRRPSRAHIGGTTQIPAERCLSFARPEDAGALGRELARLDRASVQGAASCAAGARLTFIRTAADGPKPNRHYSTPSGPLKGRQGPMDLK
jgi:hypothetical protein